jgi:hypothetical protein
MGLKFWLKHQRKSAPNEAPKEIAKMGRILTMPEASLEG